MYPFEVLSTTCLRKEILLSEARNWWTSQVGLSLMSGSIILSLKYWSLRVSSVPALYGRHWSRHRRLVHHWSAWFEAKSKGAERVFSTQRPPTAEKRSFFSQRSASVEMLSFLIRVKLCKLWTSAEDVLVSLAAVLRRHPSQLAVGGLDLTIPAAFGILGHASEQWLKSRDK